eukprot:TRINITY_DN73103_c0_g1_i1.p1 TRINITY_DN73103_c0_g1~~TRINITY_DN73103_c0_g1_i1.p1  ORF type:complete len:381 (-),score=57.97 TRINITY_DN73103_c0_g1_i1:83-1225(-)
MVTNYDAQDNLLIVACTYHATITPSVLSNPAFWMFMIIHLLIWWGHRSDLVEDYFGFTFKHDLDEGGILFLSTDRMKLVSAMTTFWTVFYTNQCYIRYFRLYEDINRVFQESHHLCFSLKGLAIKAETKRCMAHVIRHMQATVLLFFKRLKQPSLEDAWSHMVDTEMLTVDEATYLQSFPPMQVGLVLLDWMRRGVLLAYNNADANSPLRAPATLNRCFERLLEFDKVQQSVNQAVQMPVPFQYYQLLNSMVFVNVAMWAYGMAVTPSIFGPVVFFFASFLLIGMLTLANQLADPFGDDDVDFPLSKWLARNLENQQSFIHCEYPGDFEKVMFAPELKPKERRITALLQSHAAPPALNSVKVDPRGDAQGYYSQIPQSEL